MHLTVIASWLPLILQLPRQEILSSGEAGRLSSMSVSSLLGIQIDYSPGEHCRAHVENWCGQIESSCTRTDLRIRSWRRTKCRIGGCERCILGAIASPWGSCLSTRLTFLILGVCRSIYAWRCRL